MLALLLTFMHHTAVGVPSPWTRWLVWRTLLWLIAQVADAHMCPGAEARCLRAVRASLALWHLNFLTLELGCGRTLNSFSWNRPKSRSGFQRVPWVPLGTPGARLGITGYGWACAGAARVFVRITG